MPLVFALSGRVPSGPGFFSDGLGKNYLCDAYKSFFEYAYPRLLEVYSRLLYFSR